MNIGKRYYNRTGWRFAVPRKKYQPTQASWTILEKTMSIRVFGRYIKKLKMPSRIYQMTSGSLSTYDTMKVFRFGGLQIEWVIIRTVPLPGVSSVPSTELVGV